MTPSTRPLRPLPRGGKKLIFGAVVLFLAGVNHLIPLPGLEHAASPLILSGLGAWSLLRGHWENRHAPPSTHSVQ